MAPKTPKYFWLGAAVLTLAACEPGSFEFPAFGGATESAETPATPGSVRMVERDVEAPEVFQETAPALWDGRPSLGGVWVAAPGVRDPERVIIRNPANGKFVIGALFKRERNNPGPPLQLSSDAAAELGVLAGQPVQINVTALRRQEVPDPDAAPVTTAAPAASGEPAPTGQVTATSLDDPIASAAAAAIAQAEAETPASSGAATLEQPPAAAPAPAPTRASSLEKPYIQIGIFSIEQNARNTAASMRSAGLVPTVLEQESSGRRFWRVIVGPAPTASDRASVLRTVKGLGFDDAYAVTN